ncbi:hypothetical protein BDR03DRAFT_964961 [Suillus americanus]|nr:hypothetical protein BDR03DRAFT_964961 [Suillus americanus]
MVYCLFILFASHNCHIFRHLHLNKLKHRTVLFLKPLSLFLLIRFVLFVIPTCTQSLTKR